MRANPAFDRLSHNITHYNIFEAYQTCMTLLAKYSKISEPTFTCSNTIWENQNNVCPVNIYLFTKITETPEQCVQSIQN